MKESSHSGYKVQTKEEFERPSNQAPITSGLATASFFLGLLSVLLSLLVAIPALVLGIVAFGKINKSEGRLRGKPIAVAGMFLAVVLPVVNFGGLWIYRERARDAVSQNNALQISLAMLNYHSSRAQLPEDRSQEDTAKPLLSWRVEILPYLEQNQLYERFHHNEPWDSPHNLEVARNMPDVFERPGIQLEPGMTVFQRPMGNGAMFPIIPEGNKRNRIGLRNIRDRHDQTIMLVATNAENAVFWTKPQDFRFYQSQPLDGLGASWSGKLVFVMASGDAIIVPKQRVEKETLNQAFTANGGESPDLTSWQPKKEEP